ncbi:glutamine-hydrolyzing carbamoyl-phosphate synthase small subunit [Alphaproteobacteria bacterium]|nr:glutamine-hydrolyzing carbamoyl-phosphate synthase small subunit [Alphaproteobacteria bacterium]
MNQKATNPINLVKNEKNGVLVLSDGSVIFGNGIGYEGTGIGELCFNTSITGYQEIITDPSYAGQIITFTFPHIGNVGTNTYDSEGVKPFASGIILRSDINEPSNYRSQLYFDKWLKQNKIVGITNIDTRYLTLNIRENGPQNAIISYNSSKDFKINDLVKRLKAHPDLEGLDLAINVGCKHQYEWKETLWEYGKGYSDQEVAKYNVVAIDYGAKKNILRCLASTGCKITVVPPNESAEAIMKLEPDGIFLSNGPGDPAATAKYAVPIIKKLMEFKIPIFGICLGHQLLSLALGAKTIKMEQGHRGANHPVKDLETGKVEITSQNHGFVVDRNTLPENIKETHISLFDQTNEGIKSTKDPFFSVQFHPEASPGPQDSYYLFKDFVKLLKR